MPAGRSSRIEHGGVVRAVPAVDCGDWVGRPRADEEVNGPIFVRIIRGG